MYPQCTGFRNMDKRAKESTACSRRLSVSARNRLKPLSHHTRVNYEPLTPSTRCRKACTQMMRCDASSGM